MSSKPERYSKAPGKERTEPKSRRNPAAFAQASIDRNSRRLEPLGAAPATMIPARPAIAAVATIPIATVAIPVAVGFLVPPALVAEMREDLEATLLAVVEGLVKRI